MNTWFDPGLQPERTNLAWRRTTVAMTVGALLWLRFAPPALGVWSAVAGVTGALVSVALGFGARKRARKIARALRTGRPLPGATTMTILALVTAGGAIIGLASVTLMAASRP